MAVDAHQRMAVNLMAVDLETLRKWTTNPLELWRRLSPEQQRKTADSNRLLWTLHNIKQVDGDPFCFKNYMFLIPIYLQEFSEGVIQKAAQIGATVLAISWFMFNVKRGRNGIYYLPTDNSATPFVQGRVDRLLDENPAIREIVPKADSTRLKQIGKGFGHFLGLTGSMQKHSTPASLEVFDELDRAPGPKEVEVAEERTGAAESPMKLWLSTPTFPNFGINKKFMATNQQHYLMRCPHCSKWSYSPTASDNKTPADEELQFPQCLENGFLACRHCGKNLKGFTKAEWVAKFKNVSMPGWHITRLMSPLLRPDKLLKKFHEATNIQNFYNSDLGLPYADGESFLSKDQILSMCGDYSPYVTMDKQYSCTSGIDCGKVLNAVISRPSTIGGRVREYVWVGEIKGFGDEKYLELGRLLKRFNVRKFVIDGAYDTSAVEKFLMSWRGKGYASFYSETSLLFKWTNPGTQEVKNNIPIIHQVGRVDINRTESLDTSHSVLRDKKVVFPRTGVTMEDFADHCMAIARMEFTSPKDGHLYARWVQDESQRDDYRHAFNYDVMCWDTRAMAPPGSRLVRSPNGVDKTGRRL